MKIEEFNAYLASHREQIDAELKNILGELEYSTEFKQILDYALFPSGKRLRPILLLEWHNVFSPPDKYALRFACGIEILHSYSLIHDDMPCMDNDDYRRGKPTVHKKFGEGKALLAGDALLDLAYRVLNMPMPNGEVSPFCMYSSLCGDVGLIGGQYADLYGNIDNLDDLLKMYKYKTGSLITLACLSGFVLGNNLDYKTHAGLLDALRPDGNVGVRSNLADDRQLLDYVLVTGFGEAFGIAFQLYDDITEYIGGERISQTSVMNYVDLDQAKRLLNNRLNDAAKSLDVISVGDVSFLRELLNKFIIV